MTRPEAKRLRDIEAVARLCKVGAWWTVILAAFVVAWVVIGGAA